MYVQKINDIFLARTLMALTNGKVAGKQSRNWYVSECIGSQWTGETVKKLW